MKNKHPAWLRKRSPLPSVLTQMKGLLDGLGLHTVCESAQCPNQGECFSQGTATFLILGDVCTRNCHFCAVKKGRPLALDTREPHRVAQAVVRLRLGHVVVTSVTRDDLPDGGARHFASTVTAIRQVSPDTIIEVLVPDFQGSLEALKVIIASSPQIVNHNLETVPRLYSMVRPKADYQRSFELLYRVKIINDRVVTKSGLMLGLGESSNEVIKVLSDLQEVSCDLLTLGQYLSPSPGHIPVFRYVTPQEFEDFNSIAQEMGFGAVSSGPFVRSSFNAAELFYHCNPEKQPISP